MDGREGHLERFHRNSVAGGRRERTPETLSQGFRGRWKAESDTCHTFAGIPWQVGGGKGHLEHFRRKTVPGGRQKRTPGTLSQEYRARWTTEKDTWYTFAGIPCQVGSREMPPGTLSQEFRARWTAGKDTWNTFAGKPWQVDGGKGHLKHFCGNTVAGGRRERTPETLLQGFRVRWKAGRDTWNTFAGIPCQVEGGKGHLEHFRGISVPGFGKTYALIFILRMGNGLP